MVIFELSKHFETETEAPASFSAVVVNGPQRWFARDIRPSYYYARPWNAGTRKDSWGPFKPIIWVLCFQL